jgi:guanine deaminase
MKSTRDLRRIFKAFVLNPITEERVDFYDPGYLVVDSGRVLSLTESDPRPDFADAEFHDLSGFALMPAFVDTHVHLPQFAIMGIGSASLLDWLAAYTYPEEMRFADREYAASISEVFFDQLIRNGTTCAAIYCSVHEAATDIAFETAKHKGVRAFIGKTMMTRNGPRQLLESEVQSIQASIRLYDKWDGANGGRLRYVFTPRFAGSCSLDIMRRTAQVAADRQAFIQSHLSENLAEIAWIRSLFPQHTSYAEVYGSAGILGPRTIMGHCIHLSEAEIQLLAASQTSVAFCPYSNRALLSGTMPYARLKRAGLTIGLGTDVAGGPSLSMLRQMGEALNSANSLEQSLSPAGALYLATLGGAQVLGLDDRIGSFAPGKDADFVVVDYRQADPLGGAGNYKAPAHILSQLCYRGELPCIKDVYMGGASCLHHF